jgi:hypothetical protein
MLLPESRHATELIEVVRLAGTMEPATSPDLPGRTVAVWAADEAAGALELMLALPPGERARCFLPGWGIRAHGPAEEPLFLAAICFRCNGVRVWSPPAPGATRTDGFHPIDGQSPPARELLRRFRATEPAPVRWLRR